MQEQIQNKPQIAINVYPTGATNFYKVVAYDNS